MGENEEVEVEKQKKNKKKGAIFHTCFILNNISIVKHKFWKCPSCIVIQLYHPCIVLVCYFSVFDIWN